MKLKQTRFESVLQLGLFLMAAAILAGCNSQPSTDPATAALDQEREKLQAENQSLAEVRTENEEVLRLKKENQELPKTRSQYQEAGRLKKENEQLRQQVAKLSPPGAATNAAADAPNPSAPLLAQHDKDKAKELQESTINEGDEILLEPKYLKQVLPDLDWEKLGGTEPIAVRAILEKAGLPITNALQLRGLGITNYVIQRKVVPPQPQGQPVPQP